MNVRERIIGSKEKNTTKQSILQINCSLCIKSVKSQGDYRKELACFLCLIDRVMVVDNNVKAIEINKIYKMPYEDVLQFLNLSKFVKDIEDKGRLFVKKADRKFFFLENYCLFPEDLTNLKKSFTNQTFFDALDLKPVCS